MLKQKIFLLLGITAISAFSFLFFYRVFAAPIPSLQEGTYLTGQTLSVWPSWSQLGNALGKALPVDPINQLGLGGTCATTTNRFCITGSQCPNNETCVLHDPSTGWSTADRRFSFACNPDSYAYRYIVSSSTGAYVLRAKFEDAGIAPVNFNNFVAGFISTATVKIDEASGVCNFDQEISTMEGGRCGDGRLNAERGEQCDPPGRIAYQEGCVGTIKQLRVCNNSCQWTASTTLCSNLSRCGNGQKEAGETCDDGNLNGRYNHCNATCTGLSTLGACGNGTVESAYEVCDPGTPGQEKYSLAGKNSSCAWDCQNWGPYCGDNITQAEHGEQCDGSQVCSVDGRQGSRVCNSSCKRENQQTSLSWWPFEELNAVSGGMSRTLDASNNNEASCLSGGCPRLEAGRIGQALAFSGEGYEKKFLAVDQSASLDADSVVSVEAWVKPTSYDQLYQRIVEKGGPNYGGGYGLEFNASSSHTARFNLWRATQTSVDTTSAIPLNTWTHIVGTFEHVGNNNIAKIYVNGRLENTNIVVSSNSVLNPSTAQLLIGASFVQVGDYSNYFFGSIDEVKVYTRVLSADEVLNNFQTGWLCQTSSTTVTPVVSGSCGNGVVDANEACDRGAANNGRTCTPTYGRSCSYCAADCQNTIDVQPLQYCGNGIIESTEKCDMAAGEIFTSATSTGSTTTKDLAHNGYRELSCAQEPSAPHTIKKGTKTCDSCSVGVIKNCISCGVDNTGVSVSGGLLNVLVSSTLPAAQRDHLFTRQLTSSSVYLSIGTCYSSTLTVTEVGGRNICSENPAPTSSPLVGKATKNQSTTDLASYALLNPYGAGTALVSSNPSCSTDTDSNKRYLMYLNNDWARPFNFTVVAAPQPWQYDFVLSPIIDNTLRTKDVRVVLSWVGPDDFVGGVLNPFVTSSEITGASYCNVQSPLCNSPKKHTTGVLYYNAVNADWYGIWYHGFNTTAGNTNAESFTINTAAMSSGTYSVYVKSPVVPIRQFKNTARIKAEIYLPEVNNNPYFEIAGEEQFPNLYRFGIPVKTIYFQAAAPSDNPNAKYWQIFNINKPADQNPVTIDDILEINTIKTGGASFVYSL